MKNLILHLSKPLFNIPPIEPVAGGPGYSAAQKIAGQALGVFLIVAAIAIIVLLFTGIFSWRSHHSGGVKTSVVGLAVIVGAVIIAGSVAQIINWGQAIPLFG